MLLAIFAINMAALCSCGFGQTSSHKMKMEKDCCCCKKNTPEKNCKDTHAVQFNQADKLIAQQIIFHPFVAIVSPIFHWENETVIKIITVYNPLHFIDTSPPDLRVLYRSFLI